MRAAAVAAVFLWLSACAAQDGGHPSDPGGPDDGPDPTDPCAQTLQEITDNIYNDYHKPTWETLDCFRDGLTRVYPSFTKRLLVGGDVPGTEPGGDPHPERIHFALWDSLWNNHPVNVSSHLFGVLGPFVDTTFTLIEYPLYPDHHDSRLRWGMVPILREKLAGKPVVMAQFVPPEDDKDGIPVVDTPEEFKAWVEEIWIPWRVEEAKAAERFMVEYYVPGGMELEMLFQRQHNLVNTLTTQEQVELVQWWVDRTVEAVRPHFTGKLQTYVYVRFEFLGDEWKQMSYAGFDDIGFNLQPECDLEYLETYMNQQLEGYSQIVQNSGNIPWHVSEITITRKSFEQLCGTDFDAVEADLYRAAFRILDDAPMPSPWVGIGILSTLPQTDQAWAVIDSFFAAH